MSCRLFLFYILNFLALLLGVGLLVLGVRTELGGLTGMAIVILVIAFLGCYGACTEGSCILIVYSICMLLLAMLCVGFLVTPESVKPLVSEQLEELILASYMNSGKLLGVGLLVLGVRTELGGLTGMAIVILVIAFLGCYGACTEGSCILIVYSICMLLLAMLCVGFLVTPESVKPLVSEQLEELILASYMNSGKVEDLKCCPRLPLEKPKDVETWALNKLVSASNKIMCVGVMGLPSCEVAIDNYLDVHGKGIAITTLAIAISAAAVAVDRAVQNRRK